MVPIFLFYCQPRQVCNHFCHFVKMELKWTEGIHVSVSYYRVLYAIPYRNTRNGQQCKRYFNDGHRYKIKFKASVSYWVYLIRRPKH